MPFVPVGQEFMDEALVNVPDDLTLLAHFCKQLLAEMSVARQVMEERFVQPSNMLA